MVVRPHSTAESRIIAEVGSTGRGKQEGEGVVGHDDAPSNRTWSAMGQVAKNILGNGPASKGFHTVGPRRATSSVPDEAVDKGARKPKDPKVGGKQSAHLPHHEADTGDRMPAVKDSASLPSKKKGATSQQSEHAQSSDPVGTEQGPGSKAIDADKREHSPSFENGPRWV